MAQNSQPLRGAIQSDGLEDLSWLSVHLDAAGFGQNQSAMVSPRGDFEFDSVPAGFYTLRVIDSEGREITSQPISLRGANAPVTIRLPHAEAGNRPTGESVSIVRLRHKVPKKALQAARKAESFSQHGEYQKSADEWKAAIAADPEFSDAYGNLGNQYVRMHRPAEALEPYRRAIELDPYTPLVQTNLAVALAEVGKLDEAETVARRSLQANDADPRAHYVLGCVLAARKKDIPEAIREFQISSRRFGLAHQALGLLYQSEGRQEMAAAEFQQYQASQAGSRKTGLSSNALLEQ